MRLLPSVLSSVVHLTTIQGGGEKEILFPTSDGDKRIIFPDAEGDDFRIQFPT